MKKTSIMLVAMAAVIATVGCGRSTKRAKSTTLVGASATGAIFRYNCIAQVKETDLKDKKQSEIGKQIGGSTLSLVDGNMADGNTVLNRTTHFEAVVSSRGSFATIAFNSYGQNNASELASFRFQLGEEKAVAVLEDLQKDGKSVEGSVECELDKSSSSLALKASKDISCVSDLLKGKKSEAMSKERISLASIDDQDRETLLSSKNSGISSRLDKEHGKITVVSQKNNGAMFYGFIEPSAHDSFQSVLHIGDRSIVTLCDPKGEVPKFQQGDAFDKRGKAKRDKPAAAPAEKGDKKAEAPKQQVKADGEVKSVLVQTATVKQLEDAGAKRVGTILNPTDAGTKSHANCSFNPNAMYVSQIWFNCKK